MSKKVSDVFINFLDKKDRDIAQGRQQGMQAEQLRMQHRQHKEQSLTEKFNQAFKTMQADRAQQNLETGRTREDQLNEIKQQNVVDNRQHQIDIMNQRDGLADGNREDAQSHDINMLNRRHSNSQEMDLLNHEQALATKSVSKSDGPISLEQKMAKLSGENRKRFDNIRMGINAINDIQSALDSGTRKFSLKGDNKFTASRRLFTEAIGRMQSGGAINSEEAKSFKGL